MDRTRILLLVLLACLFASLTSAAEMTIGAKADAAIEEARRLPACYKTTGNIQDCHNLIDQMIQEALRLTPEESTELLEEEASERLQDKVTSAETESAASPLRDAVSRFIAAAGVPGLSEDDGNLVFAYNVPNGGVFPEDFQLSLKATAKQPALYQPLLEAFEEEVRAAKKSAFEERLGDFDDIDFEIAGSRLSPRWGRDFDYHRSLFQSLWTQAAGLRTMPKSDQVGFLAVLTRLSCPQEVDRPSATFAELEEKCELTEPRADESIADTLLNELASNARAMTTGFAELVGIARTKGVMEVADLVNNQPQLFLSTSYRDRDDALAGPDQLSAQLKWEIGFHNVNGLRKFCQARGQLQLAANGQSQPTLDCVHAFVYCSKKDPTDCSPQINKARKARRASLSAEYTEIDRYQFSPEEGVDLLRDRSESVKAMLAYGWQLTTEADGTGGARLDLESVYENVSGDPLKNDRWVGSLTYSHQIADEAAASISLLWANKPEYLGEVDEELSARAGLKWTMDPGDE